MEKNSATYWLNDHKSYLKIHTKTEGLKDNGTILQRQINKIKGNIVIFDFGRVQQSLSENSWHEVGKLTSEGSRWS